VFGPQTLKRRNFTVLFLDVYYAMESAKPGEPGMTTAQLCDLVNKFKIITTAPQFSIIIFCSLQQMGPFLQVLRTQLNISPDHGVWHRKNALQVNQHVHGFTSSVEGLVFGFHDTTTSSQSVIGTKASWQLPHSATDNLFSHAGVTSTLVSFWL
jgi:hypothetical protein